MHFFNPAPLMRLVEVIAGVQSGEARARASRATLGEAMGKRVIDAADGPGFLVNRCGRPFGLEALRLAAGAARGRRADRPHLRLGGGFRMGPFELQDLVGIDVGFEVSKSFFELSLRRAALAAVAARGADGRRRAPGRKTGRGWYEYADGAARTAPRTRRRPSRAAATGGSS